MNLSKSRMTLLVLFMIVTGCDQEASQEEKDKKIASEAAKSSNDMSYDEGMQNSGAPGVLGDDEEDGSRYEKIIENEFVEVAKNPLSTFSIDVDTASYSNIRRYIESGSLPPANAVRIEEMINYFEYDYPQPEGDAPFSTTLEIASSPWKPEHRLLKIGLQGKKIAQEQRPAANLVFLVDVSGSMSDDLELLKAGLKMLTETLSADDRVAIVVYAGASGMVLDSTSDKAKIIDALSRLHSGGGTNGEAGIQMAYKIAEAAKIQGGINRVILATDGDFNIGVSGDTELVGLIKSKADTGIELSVLGFGFNNLNDSMIEKITNSGNGNYSYIDNMQEAKKVLVHQVSGTLFTIAKDVKIQIEFNPAKVASYRLIGYENRLLKSEDFNDDTKDAGEIGAGHTVTALYEIIPVIDDVIGSGFTVDAAAVDPLVYQTADGLTERGKTSGESVVVKLRYKKPAEDSSNLQEFSTKDEGASFDTANADFKFCSSVASFGMLLRNSPNMGASSTGLVLTLAEAGVGTDLNGYRKGFLELVRAFEKIAK